MVERDPGKIIDEYQYETKDLLGKGAFGAVYKGVDTKRNRTVAVKVIPSSTFEQDKELMNMLKREIANMMAISQETEYVVKLYDVKRSKSNLYMMLEFCDDGSLEDLLKRNKNRVSEAETVNIIRQVLNGFKVLHKHQIAHRDLKPQNILLQHGTAKVADFGFSKVYEGPSLMTSLLGSPLYAAPQILMGQKYSNKCDIYSLGVMMFEMIFGTFPWLANTPSDLSKKHRSVPLVIPNSPPTTPEMKELLKRMLIIDDASRITWEELFNHPFMNPPKQDTKYLDSEVDDLKRSVGFLKFNASNNLQVYNAAELRRLQGGEHSPATHQGGDLNLDEHKDPPQAGKFAADIAQQILKDEELKKEYRKYGNRIAYERTLLRFLTRYLITELYGYLGQLGLRQDLYYRVLFSTAKYYMNMVTQLKENLENKVNVYGFPKWDAFTATRDYQDFVQALRQEYAGFCDFFRACLARTKEFVHLQGTTMDPKKLTMLQAVLTETFKPDPNLNALLKDSFQEFFHFIKGLWPTAQGDKKLLLLLELMVMVDRGIYSYFPMDDNNTFDFLKYSEDREGKDPNVLRQDVWNQLAPF